MIAAVRLVGHQLTEDAQLFSELERTTLTKAIEQSRNWLLLTLLGVGLVGALLGTVIARSVVRPLRQLEHDLEPIAAGHFRQLPPPSNDQEMVALAAAFNRMLAELDERRRQLLHSEKLASLGILVAGVAHELNNPLSNISTACQLGLEDLASQEYQNLTQWLQQIDTQTQRAHHILLALSDYARRRPLTLEAVEIIPLLKTTLLLIRKELGRQVTLEQMLPEGLTIKADSQRLQQVFINLLKNAVDAGGPEVTITLSARAVENIVDSPLRFSLNETNGQQRRYAQITVADNGEGINPETLPHIFDPFFTTRAVGQGMGLGLYIVQEIIRELAGGIVVESEPGKGTSFHLILPCAREVEA
ncbi:MAG: HAMP domain-containing histidine kinase [Gammaproteobacteria bacterium]|nr:HAMP domain-containing histidine kinase [Gammaproteobacteria bacterium]